MTTTIATNHQFQNLGSPIDLDRPLVDIYPTRESMTAIEIRLKSTAINSLQCSQRFKTENGKRQLITIRLFLDTISSEFELTDSEILGPATTDFFLRCINHHKIPLPKA